MIILTTFAILEAYRYFHNKQQQSILNFIFQYNVNFLFYTYKPIQKGVYHGL